MDLRRRRVAENINSLRGGPILITRRDCPAAVIRSIGTYVRMMRLVVGVKGAILSP
jgi:PHD/YefM family antitoxin component YafN of YafNO toxin-antitoxin module